MSYFVFDLPLENSAQLSREVRENLNALAVNNATANPDKPANPRNGMLRFYQYPSGVVNLQYYWDGWKNLFINMQLGITTLKRVELNSPVPAAIWTIDHNFGTKPVAQFVDSTNDVVVPESINHVNNNRTIITHGAPIAGTAILIG